MVPFRCAAGGWPYVADGVSMGSAGRPSPTTSVASPLAATMTLRPACDTGVMHIPDASSRASAPRSKQVATAARIFEQSTRRSRRLEATCRPPGGSGEFPVCPAPPPLSLDLDALNLMIRSI
eukprot:2957592-Prymnesium_polylepis.2